MAYVASTQDEEELKKQQAAGQTPQTQNPTTGPSGDGLLGSNPGGAQAPNVPNASKTSPSGSWTNLKAYLNANQDQSVDLSNQIAGNIQKTGEDAKSSIDNLSTQYQKDLNTAAPDPSSLVSDANKNVAQFASNPDNVTKFKNLSSGVYKGPDTFETYGSYGDVANKAQQAGEVPKTAGGQQELVRQLNPSMKQGNVDLNQLLISGNPIARQNLQNAAAPYANLMTYLGDQTKSNNDKRSQAVSAAANAKSYVDQNFVQPQTQNLNQLQSQINQRIQNDSVTNEKNKSYVNDLQNYVSGKNPALTQEELDAFGLTGKTAGSVPIDKISSSVNSSFGGNGLSNEQLKVITDKIVNAINTGDYSVFNNQYGTNYAQKSIAEKYRGYQVPIQDKLKEIGSSLPQDWLSKYFDSSLTTENPTFANEANPDEAAQIYALQQLIDGTPQYLSQLDLQNAGSFKPTKIGKFKGF